MPTHPTYLPKTHTCRTCPSHQFLLFQVPRTSHVLSGVTLTYPSPVNTHAPTTFTHPPTHPTHTSLPIHPSIDICFPGTRATSLYPSLCRFAFQVPHTSHVLSGVTLTYPSPVNTHTPTTFTLSGHPGLVTSLSWTLGDGARRDVASTNTPRVTHTYLHPGSFLLRVDLCWSGVCRDVRVAVQVDSGGSVRASLTCPTLDQASGKVEVNASVSNSFSSTVKWSRTSSSGGTVYGKAGLFVRLFRNFLFVNGTAVVHDTCVLWYGSCS